MIDDNTNNETRRPHLRVIQGSGGRAQLQAQALSSTDPARGTMPAEVEAQRLCQAILRLPVEGIGQTVEETLQEVSDKLDSEEFADISRCGILTEHLERMGLRFIVANPALELAREGFLVLAWPDRVLRRHPELSGLHPLAHPAMPVG